MKLTKTVKFALALILCLSSHYAKAQTDMEVPEYKTLDKTNLVIKEWFIDPLTNVKTLDHSTTYNSDGKKIEEEEYDDRGLQWRKIFEYGANGKVAREMTYDFRNRLDNVKKFEYNEFNRRAKEYTYNARGKLVKIKIYEYIVAK